MSVSFGEGGAIEADGPVWFLAQKPDLVILDVVPAGWALDRSQSERP